MAYVPYSFVAEAGGTVKSLEIDDGDGCVAPSVETVQDGTYKPLGRPLFVYPSADALQRPEALEFLQFYIDNQESITEAATFIPMTEEQAQASSEAIDRLSQQAG
jgi:phosphate transport system substrate-binding protein